MKSSFFLVIVWGIYNSGILIHTNIDYSNLDGITVSELLGEIERRKKLTESCSSPLRQNMILSVSFTKL